MRTFLAPLCLFAPILVLACEPAPPLDAGADPDGGVSADPDGGVLDDDGGVDAGLDAGPADAGSDAGLDGGVDAGLDAGSDAGSADAGFDAGYDAGPPTSPISDAGAVLVQEGFLFLEGPVWRPAEGVLLFTDIPADRIYRLSPPSTVDTFRDPSGKANGLLNDAQGRLLAAEHGGRRVSRTLVDGGVVTVADSYDGGALNSPNDLALRADGTIYFTDPPYGLEGRPRELDFNGVFRVTPAGALVLELAGAVASRPNGVVLSPDDGTLYLADTAGDVVRAYDVASDGSLSNERTFASVSSPDGMAVDVEGNVYVTTADGVEVFAPGGARWGVIDVARTPANCAFGDADYKTLYITAREGLYRARTLVEGLP
jgi:gluconolactonase